MSNDSLCPQSKKWKSIQVLDGSQIVRTGWALDTQCTSGPAETYVGLCFSI